MNGTVLIRLLAAACILAATVAAFPGTAQAGQNRYCARFNTSYWDSMSGQDLLASSPVNANKHWAVVKRMNPATAVFETIWQDYMTDNCTPWFDTPGVTVYQFSVTSAVRVGANRYVFVYPDTGEQWVWYTRQDSLFSNPFGNVTTTVTWAAAEEIHASLVGSVMGTAELTASTYKVYARQGCAGGLSCTSNAVFLGTTSQTGSDAFSKSVIGHELGHLVQSRLFGIQGYSYGQDATQATCRCDHVAVVADRAHCLQSREQVGAARLEGWGHFYATRLYNTPSDSSAPFGYYKNFLNPGASTAIVPPVNADALVAYRWMESQCTAASRGTELDWLGFFYYANTRTANSYSYANFKTVFEQECGGTCNGSDTVTWQTLQSAATAVYGAGTAKANHLINTGDAYGVDH